MAIHKIHSILRLIKFLVPVALVSSCNHLFYHPHQQIYLTPEKVNLSFEELTIPVNDEITLHAWHIKPRKKSKSPVSIIQFHGNAENRSTHFLSVAWLANYGADVIVFDYRGYNGSTGSPSRSGLVEDGVVMLNWFARNYPSSRRFVIGQSLGGAVAVAAVAKSNAKMDGVILESTFYSYRGVARMKLASSWIVWPFQWLPWIVLSGDEDPIDYVAKISVPVLAFHDRNDPVVPYAAGEKLYQHFKPKQLTLVPMDGNLHTAAFIEEREESRKMALDFLGLQETRD